MSDSYFIWSFVATSGDAWGGALYDDSSRYNVGSTVQDVAGTYRIEAEYAFGVDLTAAYGINEGEVTTTWYYDAQSGQTLGTLSNGAYRTGFGGLGSEYDYALTGSGTDDFGDGGRFQADAALPDSYYIWTFYAYSGDQWGGTLYDDSRDYAPGSVLYDVNGYYLINSEAEFGFDLSSAGYGLWEGQVTTSWYYDAGSGWLLDTWSGGQVVTSWLGLGEEYDYAWTGWDYDDFGVGGIHQANVPVYWSYAPAVTYEVSYYDTYDYGYYDSYYYAWDDVGYDDWDYYDTYEYYDAGYDAGYDEWYDDDGYYYYDDGYEDYYA